jgi:hypothetical protein
LCRSRTPFLGLATALACVAFLIPVARPASAAASAQRPTKLWLIKVNDLAAIGDRYGHDFRWQACGLGTGGPFASTSGPCSPGQVPIYANFRTFRKAVRAGILKRGMTVLFDQETWPWTPAWEQADPARYLIEAGQIAQAHGITLIESVYATKASTEINLAVASARYASVVSIQSQRFDLDPPIPPAQGKAGALGKFLRFVQDAVGAIRAHNKRVPILAGLATDGGGFPVTAADMTAEYNAAYPLVQGFWLNADQWPTGPAGGCETTGCGATGRAFLSRIGVRN